MESKFGKEQDMKLNRFAALTIIALLAIGAMGLLSTRSLAKAPAAPVGQAQVTSVAPGSLTSEQPGVEEPAQGPDTDTVEEQVGEQVEDGQPDGAEAPGAPDESVQEPFYASSVAVDQAQTEGMSETDEAAALQDKATLSAADAETAALVANRYSHWRSTTGRRVGSGWLFSGVTGFGAHRSDDPNSSTHIR
jgi:hypothetical protein